MRPMGSAEKSDVREVIGGREGAGLDGTCKADANIEVDGGEEEVDTEYADDDEGAVSNGMGSRFLVVKRGIVRELVRVLERCVELCDDGGKNDS